jgi:hypothetical protein
MYLCFKIGDLLDKPVGIAKMVVFKIIKKKSPNEQLFSELL